MREIAFVTYAKLPQLTADDTLVAHILSRRNVHTKAVSWDDPQTDWNRFEGIILRSCWNYHLHETNFREWLMQMERQRKRLFNPSPVVAWNMDKTYLQQLALAGIPVPPACWLKKGEQVNLLALLIQQNWQKAVVKPVVSASAYQTWLTTSKTASADQPKLDNMLSNGGVIIQAFVEEVQTKGEWSLVFFNNRFSHGVLKRTKANDFRVQAEFGGTVIPCLPPEAIRRQAQYIVDVVRREFLYARVDGIEVDGTFLLMELELIEPALFLNGDTALAGAFADAIAANF